MLKQILGICFYLSVQLLFTNTGECNSTPVEIAITSRENPYKTEEEFVSFCLDPYLKHDLSVPWGNFSFSNPRVLTLARGLSPAILRWGGTDADWSVFYPDKNQRIVAMIKENNAVYHMDQRKTNQFIVPIYKEDISNLRKLAQAAGGKLLYDMNIQKRNGNNWDPTNAKQIMQYMIDSTNGNKVEDVVFELGNEWPYPIYHPTPLGLANDFLQFNKTVFSFPQFSGSYIVGPDLGLIDGFAPDQYSPIISQFVKSTKSFIRAVTIHHYYFKGPECPLFKYFDLKYYDGLKELLVGVRKVMNEAGGEETPLWLGETSDSYSKGTPGITDRFAGSFLWLDKLGLSASVGVSLVARQDFYGGNYPLLNEQLYPNPDYWISYIHKQLVGQTVLDVNSKSIEKTTRLYAQCASKKAGYPPGSITVFALNIGNSSSSSIIFIGAELMDVYEITGAHEGSVLSSAVSVNGKQLEMVDDNTLPKLIPKEQLVTDGLVLNPKTIVFVVLKDIKFKACMA